MQSILIASSDGERAPLRVYAVRDPRLVEISKDPVPRRSALDAGFERVTLDICLDRARAPNGPRETTAVAAKADLAEAGNPANGRPVMAFLLTIGLAENEENSFFSTVVRDFLTRSWMTIPTLLSELGCTNAHDVADGDGCAACPRSPA